MYGDNPADASLAAALQCACSSQTLINHRVAALLYHAKIMLAMLSMRQAHQVAVVHVIVPLCIAKQIRRYPRMASQNELVPGVLIGTHTRQSQPTF